MVNYRRVVCEVALLLCVLAVTAAAPACDDKDHKLVYDQRQNGTENYRLNIDGVVIAVAPAESFLSALSDIDFSDLIDLESLEQELKPKPPASSISEDLLVPKPEEKPVLDAKPEEPAVAKPDEKPSEAKPDKPEAPTKIDDVSVEPVANLKGHKKSAQLKRQETTQR